jgi:hypothetical protein
MREYTSHNPCQPLLRNYFRLSYTCTMRGDEGRGMGLPGEQRRPRLVEGPIRSREWVRESTIQFLPSPLRRKIFMKLRDAS